MREEPRGTGTITTRLRSCRNDKTRKNESTDGSMTIDDDRRRLEIEREASRRGGKSVGEIVRGTFYMPPDGETPRRPTSETLPRAIRRFLSLPPRVHPLPEWNVSHPVGPSCPASDPSSLLSPRSCFLHISFVIRRLVPARASFLSLPITPTQMRAVNSPIKPRSDERANLPRDYSAESSQGIVYQHQTVGKKPW